MKSRINKLLGIIIIGLVGIAVYSNIAEQLAIDQSKIPEKVEKSKDFQKWITNLKNKDFEIEADEFRLKEENEVYNTQRMWVYSIDNDDEMEKFEKALLEHKDLDQVVYSPSERGFIDYRHELRVEITGTGEEDGIQFAPNDARYYGVRDDKLIDSKILSCYEGANCYFDRAYFLSNDVFVISEISRNIEKRDIVPPCLPTETCIYTFKIHVIDLINNSNLVYESKPFELVLTNKLGDF